MSCGNIDPLYISAIEMTFIHIFFQDYVVLSWCFLKWCRLEWCEGGLKVTEDDSRCALGGANLHA